MSYTEILANSGDIFRGCHVVEINSNFAFSANQFASVDSQFAQVESNYQGQALQSPGYPLQHIPYLITNSMNAISTVSSGGDKSIIIYNPSSGYETFLGYDPVAGEFTSLGGGGSSSVTEDMIIPVGSIIALHPDINQSKAINAINYVQCDSTGGNVTVTYSDGTTDSIALPNLSDSRFLMGGTASGTGGSNILLDHLHACGTESAAHSHSGTTANPSANHSHSANPPNTYSAYYNTSHTHTMTNYNGTTYSWYRGAHGGDSASSSASTGAGGSNHRHTTNIGAFNTGTVSAWHKHTITTGTESAAHTHVIGTGAVPGSTSSLPQYYTVIFFMRIK